MDDRKAGRASIAVLVMLVTPLLFSTNLIFGRSINGEVAPFTLAFLRWTLVAIALAPFLYRERDELRRAATGAGGRIALLGFLGMFLCGGVPYVALGYTTATNATLIYTTSPVIIILIEAMFSGRRIGWREGLGSAIAFAGVATIVMKGSLSGIASLGVNRGDLLIVGTSVAWAVYSISYRSQGLSRLSNLALFGAVAAAGAVMLLPAALFEFASGHVMPVTATAWMNIAGIVVFSSLAAFSGYQFGVRALGASLAGIFMYLLPPYGVLLSALLLGESFEHYHAAGVALVMGGVILATLPASWLPGQG